MKDEFVKVCMVSEIYSRKGRRFQLDDENEIALFKAGGNIYAIDNICPHNHTAQMYDGYIENMYIACPVHGFQFHLKTGEQPTKEGCRLRTFEVKIENDIVYVKKPSEKRFDFKF
ncbi:MAG: nitrite reductase (NAD(P)H) small subunit [Bacteroidetes bacterium]|nr:nitrite reductase (NAD(P)H) small subunit [Bacteroidota bacterium]